RKADRAGTHAARFESGRPASGHARAARALRHADETGGYQDRVNHCSREDLSPVQGVSCEIIRTHAPMQRRGRMNSALRMLCALVNPASPIFDSLAIGYASCV